MEEILPKGWVETELGNILKLKNGFAFKSEDFKDTGIPVIRISNIQNEQVETKDAARVDHSKIKQEFIVQKGDILIAMSGATTGKYGIYNENIVAAQNQRVGNLVPHEEDFTSKRFIYYLLGGLKKEIEDKAYGGAQPNISPKIIEEIIIGLPPLPEQQRIVAKLDILFGQIDRIKTSMERIPQLLKDFRQKVLTQAVTGKLTEEWREGRELESEWEKKKIEEVLLKSGIFDGPFGSNLKTDDYVESGVQVIRLENILHLMFDESKKTYISEEKYETLKRHTVYEGDIIFSSFISEEIRACFVPRLSTLAIAKADCFCLKYNPEVIENKFLLYKLVSPETYFELQNHIHGATRPRVNTKQLKQLFIKLPQLQEQQEIVRRVESLFAKADQIEARYQKLKEKIEQLPQALLAKAFRGELVEQLPTDGDARDLLEQIKQAKAGLEKSGMSKKLKVEDEVRMVAEDGVKYGK